MAKNDQQEAFEKSLSSTLARVVDFLKYAEAKNAALLTFASAWILGSINLLGNVSLSHETRLSLQFALPLFAGGALVAVFSFLPRMGLSKLHKDPSQDKSLLYFADIATFSPAAYKARVRSRYLPSNDESATESYLDDLSIQIAVNSQIVTRKLKLFNFGALIVLVALFVLSVPALVSVWKLTASIIGAP